MCACLAFNADGSILASSDRQGDVVLWEVATGKRLGAIDGPAKQQKGRVGDWFISSENNYLVGYLLFGPDGKTLVLGGYNSKGEKRMKIWSIAKMLENKEKK